MDERSERTLDAAATVSRLLDDLNIPHAVIGAIAMAVYGFPRATEDFDFGTIADPFSSLREVASRLRSAGFAVELTTPDAEDPLGGVVTITREDIDPIQLVNFLNPFSPGAGEPGRFAIRNASADRDPGFPIVSLEALLLLKLYAGGPQSRSDILRLLEENPDLEISAIQELADQYGVGDELAIVLRERNDSTS